MRIAIAVLIITQILNAIFVPFLGHAGLALSIGLGACVNALALLIGLMRGGIYQPAPGWGKFLLRMGLGVTAMGAFLIAANTRLDWYALQATPGTRAGLLLGVVAVGGTIYGVVLLLTGLRPRDLRRVR